MQRHSAPSPRSISPSALIPALIAMGASSLIGCGPTPTTPIDPSALVRPSGLVASYASEGGFTGGGDGSAQVFEDARVIIHGRGLGATTSTRELPGGAADVSALVADLRATGILELDSGSYAPADACCDRLGYSVELFSDSGTGQWSGLEGDMPGELSDAVAVMRSWAEKAR